VHGPALPTLFLNSDAFMVSKTEQPAEARCVYLGCAFSRHCGRRPLTIVGRCHIGADNSIESLVTSIDLLLTARVERQDRDGETGGHMPTAYKDPAEAADINKDARDAEAPLLRMTGALQRAIFNSATFLMMTSSREEQDLLRSYQLGVNACVVKPMKFHDFVEAVKQVGVFWAVINEAPPGSLRPGGHVGALAEVRRAGDQT
jgi:CheY-like chemotaxis protein